MPMEELAQGLETMDPTELALGAAFAGIVTTLITVCRILWYFISAIGYRKMYLKAGEAGWKAFIPCYKDFIRFKLAWKPKLFWISLVCSLLIYFLPGSDYLLTGLLTYVCIIISLVLEVKLDLRTAKSFGKGKGCGVLLFFFPFIMSLVLGYGKAEYIGNTTTIKAEEFTEAA